MKDSELAAALSDSSPRGVPAVSATGPAPALAPVAGGANPTSPGAPRSGGAGGAGAGGLGVGVALNGPPIRPPERARHNRHTTRSSVTPLPAPAPVETEPDQAPAEEAIFDQDLLR
jgi:hypothetical protein